MQNPKIILVLGDQLSRELASLRELDPQQDVVLMAEVRDEAAYVRHNRHKIALIFAAMRHFRDDLRAAGFQVHYFQYEDGVASLGEALQQVSAETDITEVVCCEPGEHRVSEHLDAVADEGGLELRWLPDDRFLCSVDAFRDWAEGRKQLRMEYFYRQMRRQHKLLLDEQGKPEGGKWNYDQQNRAGWRGKDAIPERPDIARDTLTKEVLDLV